MRALAIVLALIATLSIEAQGFGRFGYTSTPPVPQFEVTQDGFRALMPSAEWFRFQTPVSKFRAALIGDMSATYLLPLKPLCPSKLRVDLLAPSFELYVQAGLALKLESSQAPFLSWGSGSVGNGVGSAPSPWLLVSFQSDQPPVLFAFQNGPTSIIVKGKPGAWTLETEAPYQGWIRVCAPLGLLGRPASRADALGKQVASVRSVVPVWTSPAPKLLSSEVRLAPGGLLAVWRFDSPGARIPTAALLAPLGGYPVQVRSGIRRLDSSGPDGPMAVCTEPKLAVFFPMVDIPLGRAISTGGKPFEAIGTISPFDAPSVVEIALASLLAARDQVAYEAADGALADYLVGAPQTTEPNTGQRLPFDGDGSGLVLASAHALLMQCLQAAAGDRSENAMLTSVLWTKDWLDWLPAVSDADAGTRAAAIASIAAVLHPSHRTRLHGGMLQAGLASIEGRTAWLRQRGTAVEPGKVIQAMENLRRSLFSSTPKDPFVKALLSPARVMSPHSLRIIAMPSGWEMAWEHLTGQKPEIAISGMRLRGASPTTNLESILLLASERWERLSYRVRTVGTCRALISEAGVRAAIPSMPPLPRYVEVVR